MGPGDNNNIPIVLGSDDDDLRKALEISLGVPVITIREFANDCNTHEVGDTPDIRVTIEGDDTNDGNEWFAIPGDNDDLPW